MWETVVMQVQTGLLLGVWAFVVAVVGYVVALFGEWLTVKIYRYFGIKDYMEETGFERAVVGIEFETILKELIKWWIFLAFVVQAAAILQLSVLTKFFYDLYHAYTLIALAILYFSAGAIVAFYVAKKLREAGVIGGNLTVYTVQAVILYVALVTALATIGFKGVYFLNRLVELVVTAFVIAFGLAMGIAFGLGGQETAKKILDKHKNTIEKLFK